MFLNIRPKFMTSSHDLESPLPNPSHLIINDIHLLTITLLVLKNLNFQHYPAKTCSNVTNLLRLVLVCRMILAVPGNLHLCPSVCFMRNILIHTLYIPCILWANMRFAWFGPYLIFKMNRMNWMNEWMNEFSSKMVMDIVYSHSIQLSTITTTSKTNADNLNNVICSTIAENPIEMFILCRQSLDVSHIFYFFWFGPCL